MYPVFSARSSWGGLLAEFVGDAEGGRLRPQAQGIGDYEAGWHAKSGRTAAGVGVRDGPEIGIAIFAAHDPVVPEHGFDAGAERPTELGLGVGDD